MNRKHEREVCRCVREDILSDRTGERIEVTDRPEDRIRHGRQVVEELWKSQTRHYAVEHTRIEAFDQQVESREKLVRMLLPVTDALRHSVEGRYTLSIRQSDALAAGVSYSVVRTEVARLVLDAAPRLEVDKEVLLRSDLLPFILGLRRKEGRNPYVLLESVIEGDPEELRVARIRRALDHGCPKLRDWARGGATSVLVLESDDSQHGNQFVINKALQAALVQRTDAPDMIILVQTDGHPWTGWILKEGASLGEKVSPRANGRYMYECKK